MPSKTFVTALLSFFATVPFAGLAQGQTKSVRHDPLVEAQLRATFGRADLDKDGFLDAAELARSFRGPNAKPAPRPDYDDKANFVFPGGQSGPKYQDQTYLLALDKDFDSRISWAEFDEYGEAYAAALRGQQLAQQRQRELYYRAQRNFAASRLRRMTYSRSGYNRRAYHRPVRRAYHPPARRSHATTSAAHRIQDQRRLMQNRMRQLQAQQLRLLQQRQRAIYSRKAAPVHRAVRRPTHRRHR